MGAFSLKTNIELFFSEVTLKTLKKVIRNLLCLKSHGEFIVTNEIRLEFCIACLYSNHFLLLYRE